LGQLDYKPNSCKTCGHPSHCEGAYYLEVKDLQVDEEPYMIKACNKCRCKACINKETDDD